MQSNHKFDQHMALRKDKALIALGAIKHISKQAPQEGWLLAYPGLCRPMLEHVDTVWDPTLVKEIEFLEMLQHRLFLLMKVLQDKKWHSTLLIAYKEITADRQKVPMTTKTAASREMTSVYAASHAYYQKPSEIPEEILINKWNTWTVRKQNIPT